MDSLSPECTPLKHRYDSCFNAWFEGYLQPVVLTSGPSTSTSNSSETPERSSLDARAEIEEDDHRTRIDPLVETDVTTKEHIHGDRALRAVEIPAALLEPPKEEAPTSTFRGGNLREDDVRAHPDLYPFLSRRPAHSTAPLPELVHEYAYFSQGEHEDGTDEDDEDVEELAESEKQAIEQEFGPEDSLFDDLLVDQDERGSRSGYRGEGDRGDEDDVQKVEMAQGMTEEEMRKERSRLMAEEYERNCGGLWTDYRACLQRAIDANQPLSVLLDQARLENPLDEAVQLEGGGYGAPGSEP